MNDNMTEIAGTLVPKALFRLYVNHIRTSMEKTHVLDAFASDLARADTHAMLLEYCEDDTDNFEHALEKSTERAIRREDD